jgi:hypothetical protein
MFSSDLEPHESQARNYTRVSLPTVENVSVCTVNVHVVKILRPKSIHAIDRLLRSLA